MPYAANCESANVQNGGDVSPQSVGLDQVILSYHLDF